MKTMEAGLIEYWKKRSTYKLLKMEMCEVKNMMDEKQKLGVKPIPIKLIDLSSAFFVLGIGYTLSVLVFIIEKIMSLIYKLKTESLVDEAIFVF